MKCGMRSLGRLLLAVALASGIALGLSSCGRAPTHNEVAGPSVLKANARDLEQTVITPHLEQKIDSGKNVLWCSTFQLAWNEYCKLRGGNVPSNDPKSMVSILNKKTATKKDLHKNDYVARAGIIGKGIIEKITAELDKKFQGQASPELLKLAENFASGDVVAYCYLFKALRFEYAFLSFKEPLNFGGESVASFGTADDLVDDDIIKQELVAQVDILDYVNDADFVIELKSSDEKDRLILARIAPEGTLEETVVSVFGRIKSAKPVALDLRETLQVPVLNFDVLREYNELYPPETPMVLALQSIRFRLDRHGAILKSEAIGIECASEEPKHLVFDKPFLILMLRKDAKNPYFALWVDNAELLVPFEKEPNKE